MCLVILEYLSLCACSLVRMHGCLDLPEEDEEEQEEEEQEEEEEEDEEEMCKHIYIYTERYYIYI